MSSTAKKLVLTRDSARLTFDQRCFYETNGFIVFPRLVPLDILNKCSQRFDDIASGVVDRGVITVMRDVTDRKAVNKIQDINHDDVLREYIEYNPMLDIVEAITGPNIMAVHSMLIAKPPDSGSNSSKYKRKMFIIQKRGTIFFYFLDIHHIKICIIFPFAQWIEYVQHGRQLNHAILAMVVSLFRLDPIYRRSCIPMIIHQVRIINSIMEYK